MKNKFSAEICRWFSFIFLIGTVACKSSLPTTEEELSPVPDAKESVQEVAPLEVSVDSVADKPLVTKKEEALENYKGAAKRDFDILDTELDLSFDYQRQAVLGKAKLTLKPYFLPKMQLKLDARDFEIEEIYLVHPADSSSVPYEYDEKKITINFSEALTREDTFKIAVNYTAFPERNVVAGSDAITDTKGLYFIDPLDTIPGKPTMIWTQGETEHNSKWFPTIDSPNEKFTQTFRLTVPDTLVTVSNGELIKQEPMGDGLRMDTWQMKLPHSPYLAAIAIGDFDKVEDRWGAVPLGYYVERGYGKGAAKVFENTPEMMGFFSDLLDYKYPWPKYDQVVVSDFVSGAMENTTASIFTGDMRLTAREAIDSEWDYIIAHELFHQWFGDYVTVESWANLTLNEAFANYSEFLWNEYKYGPDEAKLKLVAEFESYFREAETGAHHLIRFQYDNAEELFDAHSYSKGGAILHMLREYLGKDVFYAGLNHYLKRHALGNVEVHDLRMSFEAASGEDLNWFFNQWFLDKGHPQLALEVDYSTPGNIKLSVRQRQDLSENPLYRLPIEVSWYVGGERKTKQLMLDKAAQEFALENGVPVDQLFIDEERNLLAKKFLKQTPQQMVQQFKTSKFGIARYEALDSLSAWGSVEELRSILPLALEDDFWAIRESALAMIQGQPEMLKSNPSLEGKVYSIAEIDPRNSVRAGALDALSVAMPEKYQFAFREMVQDSSYLVAGSALMGVVDYNEGIDQAFIEEFEPDNNFRIIVPVADYYIKNSVPGKGKWFLEKSGWLSGEGLYYFMGYFSEYFSLLPGEGKREATLFLLDRMKNSTANYLKIGAFQSLLGFADDEEIMSAVVRVMKEETNETMVEYYSSFMDAIIVEN